MSTEAFRHLLEGGIWTSKPPARQDQEAVDLLHVALDHYGAIRSLRATYRLEFPIHKLANAPGSSLSLPYERDLLFAAPNKFKLTAKNGKYHSNAVSDGVRFLEFGDYPKLQYVESSAPPGPWATNGLVCKNPMLGGSPMLMFLAGQRGAHNVFSNAGGPIGFFAKDIDHEGMNCHLIGFYSEAYYGHVRILMAAKTGLIRWCSYDLAPNQLNFQNSAAVQRIRSALFDSPITSKMVTSVIASLDGSLHKLEVALATAVGGDNQLYQIQEIHDVPKVNIPVAPDEFSLPIRK